MIEREKKESHRHLLAVVAELRRRCGRHGLTNDDEGVRNVVLVALPLLAGGAQIVRGAVGAAEADACGEMRSPAAVSSDRNKNGSGAKTDP